MVGDRLMHAGAQRAATDRLATSAVVEATIDATVDIASVTAALTHLCGRADGSGGADLVIVRITGTSRDAQWPCDANIQAINKWERAIRRLEMLAASTLIAADGPCGGATLDFLLAADYAVVSPDFVLTIPQHDQLAWPGMALYGLVQRLGIATARRLILRPRDLTAARALMLGLVDEVGDDLAALVGRARVQLGDLPGGEVAVRRRLMLEAITTSFDEALGTHLAACDRELRRRSTPPSTG